MYLHHECFYFLYDDDNCAVSEIDLPAASMKLCICEKLVMYKFKLCMSMKII